MSLVASVDVYEKREARHMQYAQHCRDMAALLQTPEIVCAGLNICASALGWNTVTLVLSCIVAIIRGFATVMNYPEVAKKHEEQANKFGEVVRFIRAEALLNEGRTADFYPWKPLHAHGTDIKPEQVLTLRTVEQYEHYRNTYILEALDFEELQIPD